MHKQCKPIANQGTTNAAPMQNQCKTNANKYNTNILLLLPSVTSQLLQDGCTDDRWTYYECKMYG